MQITLLLCELHWSVITQKLAIEGILRATQPTGARSMCVHSITKVALEIYLSAYVLAVERLHKPWLPQLGSLLYQSFLGKLKIYSIHA